MLVPIDASIIFSDHRIFSSSFRVSGARRVLLRRTSMPPDIYDLKVLFLNRFYSCTYSDKVKRDCTTSLTLLLSLILLKKYVLIIYSTFILQLEKYIVTALDQDYHTMVRVLSQTSMFDEYLRSRIKSCGMTVLSQSGSIFHLRRRKWQPVTSTKVGYSQHQCH